MKRAVTPGKILVPQRPHSRLGMAGVVRCLSECVRAIQQLRDRPVFYDAASGGVGAAPSHPWRAYAEGDDKISVTPGIVFYPRSNEGPGIDMSPYGYRPVKYEGGKIKITDDGFLYANLIEDGVNQLSLNADFSLRVQLESRVISSVEVVFSANDPSTYTPPAGVWAFYPVAEVELLENDVASVVEQLLRHNPTHDLQIVTIDEDP